MTISEYLKQYGIYIDESSYIEHLKEHKEKLFKMRDKGYKCVSICFECPLDNNNSCPSCEIAQCISRTIAKEIETNIYDEKYFKIKSELVNFLIKKISNTMIQEELDI